MMPGGPAATPASPGSLTLTNAGAIDDAYENSGIFNVYWRYDGGDPTDTGAPQTQLGDPFSGGFAGQSVDISLPNWGSQTELPMTAVAFVSTVDDPRRFARSDQVAAYMGLAPSVYQTGDTHYTGSITREGDKLTRTLLAEAANALLAHYRGDCALKRWGERLAERKGGGKARIAVARKMAMVLHRMWINNEPFRAFA